jgi:hypothetical protein
MGFSVDTVVREPVQDQHIEYRVAVIYTRYSFETTLKMAGQGG